MDYIRIRLLLCLLRGARQRRRQASGDGEDEEEGKRGEKGVGGRGAGDLEKCHFFLEKAFILFACLHLSEAASLREPCVCLRKRASWV